MATWTAMRRSDFDTDEPLTLFDVIDVPVSPTVLAKADKNGTPALFDTLEEE
jgi:hypothetical protein